jgi:regulatory protein
METNNLDIIRRAAMNMLTRRDYSQHEISLKLRAKGYAGADIKTVITDLAQAGLINESRLTENFIHWRRGRGYGPLRISMELQTRGVPPDTIAEHLKVSDNAWFDEARRVWQKHFRGRMPTDYQNKSKQMRFLQYRGFTREQIESIFGGE